MRETHELIRKELLLETERNPELLDTSEMEQSNRFENLAGVGQLDLPIFKGSYESSDLTV